MVKEFSLNYKYIIYIYIYIYYIKDIICLWKFSCEHSLFNFSLRYGQMQPRKLTKVLMLAYRQSSCS